MNGTLNRKMLFVLGPVTALVMFGGAVFTAWMLVNREYREPYRAPTTVVDATPRAAGLEAERAAADAAAKAHAKFCLVKAMKVPLIDEA